MRGFFTCLKNVFPIHPKPLNSCFLVFAYLKQKLLLSRKLKYNITCYYY